MKILTFSTLYPNAIRPGHGIFVEARLRHLLASGKVESKVVAPVPWFPSANPRFGDYAAFAKVPREEHRHGIDVAHPRYAILPKVGMSLAPFLLAAGARSAISAIIKNGYDFDLIDAHYFYPDGIAAVLLGKHFGKPVVITARGSDVNLISGYRIPRRMIQWAARNAAGMVTVAGALRDKLLALGAPGERIEVLRNGVDLQFFCESDRDSSRNRLGFKRTTLLSVGHLIPLKGHDIAIRALKLLPDLDLVIAGDGPERNALASLAQELALGDRVSFAGSLPQMELRHYYAAADALVLASSREGMANVLLESMACGTPVIATAVGGSPEVVAAPAAGLLMKARTPEALASAVRKLLTSPPARAATRRYVEGFGWDATTAGQLELFGRILSEGTAGRVATEPTTGF
ncbi:MAG: glycosyltransferase family 4 protein [Betaproteobacteria bacterium]